MVVLHSLWSLVLPSLALLIASYGDVTVALLQAAFCAANLPDNDHKIFI